MRQNKSRKTTELHAFVEGIAGENLNLEGKYIKSVFKSIYRTRAIICKPRLVFFFYPIFTFAAAYIADNLCTKNGNSSFFKLKIRGL